MRKNRFRVAAALALVLAVTFSVWFEAPVKALDITISDPSLTTLGEDISFGTEVGLGQYEMRTIKSVDLDIYNVASPDTYYDSYVDLPLDTTDDYIILSTQGVGGNAQIKTKTKTAVRGFGYAVSQVVASITYDIIWSSPEDWPGGKYEIKVITKANGDTFTQTKTVTLSGPAKPPPAGITNVTDFVATDGKFTETVTAESFDGLAQLAIDKDTVGLVGEVPLTEITMVKMDPPPDPPENANVVGVVYDFGPDGATFDPPITLTLTYNPNLIPKGVAEGELVLAMWDAEAKKWVELVCTVDTKTKTIIASVSHFTPFAILAYAQPAAFTIEALSIAPTAVIIGERVTIGVLVNNTGGLTGSYEVTLKINNVVVSTKDMTIAGGTSQTVTFTTTGDTAGDHTVDVNGLAGTFKVKEVGEAPVIPVEPLPPPTNWWLIGGIIAACIIVGVIIGVVVWRLILRRKAEFGM